MGRMKAFLVPLFLACMVCGPASASDKAAPAASPAPADAPGKQDAKSAKPAIQKGMTAAEIEKIIGKPNEIKPIEVGDTKGESWIYRRVAKRTMTQTAATLSMVPTYGGLGLQGDAIVDVPEPEQRLEHVTIYQMTALLMVDGKLVASKQWLEKERHFQ